MPRVDEYNGRIFIIETVTCPHCGEEAEDDGQQLHCDWCEQEDHKEQPHENLHDHFNPRAD